MNMVTTSNLTFGETCIFGNGGTANNVQYSSWSCTKIPNSVGSVNSEVNYIQLTTPTSVTFAEGGKVPFTNVVSQKGSQITQNGGEITLKGGSSYRISSDLRLTSPNSGI